MKEHIHGLLDRLGVHPPDSYLKQIDEIISFRSSLSEETDKGCALMAASFLEHRTLELLKAFLVEDEKVFDILFSHNGPLSSFSSRIDMAYSLGLIPAAMRRDLHILRKIRNEFAHTSDPIDFNTPSIADRCKSLYYSGEACTDQSPRDCFTRAMLGIDGSIYVDLISLKNIKAKPDEDLTLRKQMFETMMRVPIDTNDHT